MKSRLSMLLFDKLNILFTLSYLDFTSKVLLQKPLL